MVPTGGGHSSPESGVHCPGRLARKVQGPHQGRCLGLSLVLTSQSGKGQTGEGRSGDSWDSRSTKSLLVTFKRLGKCSLG